MKSSSSAGKFSNRKQLQENSSYVRGFKTFRDQVVIILRTEAFQTKLSYFSILVQIGSHVAFLFFAVSVPRCCNKYVSQQYALQRALPVIGITLNLVMIGWLYSKKYFDDIRLLHEVTPEPIVPYSMSSASKTTAIAEKERADRLSQWNQGKMIIEIIHDIFFAVVITYFFLQFGSGASLVGCVLATARCTVLLGQLIYSAINGAPSNAVSIPVILYITHSLCILGVWIAAFISLVSEAGLYRSSACYDPVQGGWFSDNALCGPRYCGAVNNISTSISSVAIGGDLYSYCNAIQLESYKFALRPDNSKGICCHWDR